MDDWSDKHEAMECAHSLCNCRVTSPIAGEAYCSDYCRTATEDGIESETCGCSHPQCDVP